MKKERKERSYNELNHLYGRIFLAIAILIIVAIPFIMWIALDAAPDFGIVLTSMLSLIVIGVTFLSMFVCDILEKKCNQKWLSSFGLGLSMVMGMISAVIVNLIAM